MPADMLALSQLALKAGREAGRFLVQRFADARVTDDRRRDVKLAEDAEAEAIIVRHLETSGIDILAEESASTHRHFASGGLKWVVDPLDGSFNFSRGFEACAVSIGLMEDGKPVLGVIVDFIHGKAYAGGVGVPAHEDGGRAIRVSGIERVEEAAMLTGLPAQRDFSPASMSAFAHQLSRVKKVRMLGSAARSLLLVSRGVFDLYVEDDIMIWDVAAGAALVEAAGGTVLLEPSSRVDGAVRLVAGASAALTGAYVAR